jgi:hypothetical protein
LDIGRNSADGSGALKATIRHLGFVGGLCASWSYLWQRLSSTDKTAIYVGERGVSNNRRPLKLMVRYLAGDVTVFAGNNISAVNSSG